ncbi:MAG: hypothetical protein FJY88_02490 [Candidatus Eisenbacteria bacterium]|nr:hypothetical protein [Candidatus Eisenbacteria bacterium]
MIRPSHIAVRRRRQIAAGAGLALVLTLGGALSPVSAAADPLEKGLRHYLDLDLPEALLAFQAYAADPALSAEDRARAHLYAAMVHVAKGAEPYEEARREIREMYKLCPDIAIDADSVPTSFLRVCYEISKEMDLLAVEAAEKREAVLAVFDFDVNAMDQPERIAPLGPGLAQMLITDLKTVRDLRVVERQKLQFVLDELEHQAGSKVDPETAARAGKLLGAGSLMFASLTTMKKEMILDIRIVRTETGEVMKAGRVTGKLDKFYEVERQAAKMAINELLAKTAMSTETRHEFGSPQTKSLEAALAYSEGVRLMDEGRLTDAFRKFELAVATSPDFVAAKRRMDGLKPFLEG